MSNGLVGSEQQAVRVIEVVDKYNARHRFGAEEHFYEWRLKPGTLDIEGTEFLDILKKVEDDDLELVCTFPTPALVRVVDAGTCAMLPLREMPMEKCPSCGKIQQVAAEADRPGDTEGFLSELTALSRRYGLIIRTGQRYGGIYVASGEGGPMTGRYEVSGGLWPTISWID